MTRDEIEALSQDELFGVMRREGLQVVHSMFATIHHRSEERPDGFSGDDLDEIGEELESGDIRRWRDELLEHFAKRTG